MQIHTHHQTPIYQLIQMLEASDSGIDPDFDLGREELEYEFATLRLTFSSH